MFSLTWSLTCCSCSMCKVTSTFSVVWWRLNPIWSLICSSAIVCCIVFTFCLVCKMLQIICTKWKNILNYRLTVSCQNYIIEILDVIHIYQITGTGRYKIKTFCSTHLQPCLMKVESHLKSDLFLSHCVLHCVYLLSCLQNVTNNLYQMEEYFELQINSELQKLYSWNPWCHSYLTNNWNWNIWNKNIL